MYFNKIMPQISHHSFKIKLMETMKYRDGNYCKKEHDNFGVRMSYHDAFQSHARRDSKKHSVSRSDINEAKAIVNRCDGATHSATKYFYRITLTQSV